MAGLMILDDEGNAVEFDPADAESFLALTGDLDSATTSACPRCRSRVVSVVALADLLASTAPHPRSTDVLSLADDAPTLHVYVVDASKRCLHSEWRDPGHEEWADAVAPPHPSRRRP